MEHTDSQTMSVEQCGSKVQAKRSLVVPNGAAFLSAKVVVITLTGAHVDTCTTAVHTGS